MTNLVENPAPTERASPSDQVESTIARMKATARADKWFLHGEAFAGKMLIVEATVGGSFSWKLAGVRVKLAEVRAELLALALAGELSAPAVPVAADVRKATP